LKTRIQVKNEARILDAAVEVFATYGYRGATIDEIADRAGISKPNGARSFSWPLLVA
jgi:TetR/AcrR family transcriptional regulator